MLSLIAQASCYAELPMRRVVTSPFNEKPTVSHGVIAHSLLSDSWLVVRGRWTPSFLNLVTGTYRAADLPSIINSLTVSEYQQLQEMLADDSLVDKVLNEGVSWMMKSIGGYVKERLAELSPLIKSIISKVEVGELLTCVPWSFPKGRAKTKDEDSISCAIREFKEETGITHIHKVLEDVCLVENYVGTNGKSYCTNYWIVLLDSETVELDNFEINEHRWISWEEAKGELTEKRYSLLAKAKLLVLNQ